MKKETQAISIIISKELYTWLKEFSKINEFSMNQTISRAIKQYIAYQPIVWNISIPKQIESKPMPTLLDSSQEEKTLWELIFENNKERCFIKEQEEDIKKYILNLSEEEQSILSDKLKDYVYDNRDKHDSIKINNFFDWIKPELSVNWENILECCGDLFEQEDFYNIKDYLRTLEEDDLIKIRKQTSLKMLEPVIIDNFIGWCKSICNN